jgi:Fe2+ transport system protein FeoA
MIAIPRTTSPPRNDVAQIGVHWKSLFQHLPAAPLRDGSLRNQTVFATQGAIIIEIPSTTLIAPTPLLADVQSTLGPMTEEQSTLCARLRQLGFKLGEPVKLYGERYQLLGDPIVSEDNSVFVAAVDKKSGQLRTLHIPMLVVKMAMERVPRRERIEKTAQHVSVETDEKPSPEFTRGARSRHHVEEVMSRILAKQRTHTKKFALGDTDQENGGTNDHWH